MKDAIFVAKLIRLLSGDLNNQVKSKPTPAEAATFFLDSVISPALDVDDKEPLNILLSVMETFNNIQLNNLALKIKKDIGINVSEPESDIGKISSPICISNV